MMKMDIMNRNFFTQLNRQKLKSWGISILISFCLALTVLFFVSESQNSQMEASQIPLDSGDFRYSLNLITPKKLGVDRWQVGDYAQYRYRKLKPQRFLMPVSTAEAEPRSDASAKSVTFHVIDELKTATAHDYWLRVSGMVSYRDIPCDIYQLGLPNDMRLTEKNRRYELIQNYVPSKIFHYNQGSMPLAKLVKLGEAEIETEAGLFECTHYRVELEQNLPMLELWANPEIRPLGIVRIQSQNEVLELTSFGQKTEIEIPEIMQPIIQGISKINHGCTSCHGYDNCHESIFPPK